MEAKCRDRRRKSYKCPGFRALEDRQALVGYLAALVLWRRVVRVVAQGVDTLHLFTTSPVRPDVVAQLEAKKAAARADRDEVVEVELAGLTLRVRRHGAKASRFMAETDLFTLLVNDQADPEHPTAQVEVRALALWSLGWEVAADKAEQLLRAVCQVAANGDFEVGVSRLDLCVDFQGWVPDPGDLDWFSCRVRRRSRATHFGYDWLRNDDQARDEVRRVQGLARRLQKARGLAEQRELLAQLHAPLEAHDTQYGDARRFSGFTFGRGILSSRLYDKTAELSVSRKGWFRQVWRRAAHFKEKQPVFRLEFQLRREALLELKTPSEPGAHALDVSSWGRCKAALPELWSYLTRRWMRHGWRDAEKRHHSTRMWQALQGAWLAVDHGAALELHRDATRDTARATIPALAGYLSSSAAQMMELSKEGGEGQQLPYWRLMLGALRAAHEYATIKGHSLEQRYEEKRAELAARRRTLSGPRRQQLALHLARGWAAGARPGGTRYTHTRYGKIARIVGLD